MPAPVAPRLGRIGGGGHRDHHPPVPEIGARARHHQRRIFDSLVGEVSGQPEALRRAKWALPFSWVFWRRFSTGPPISPSGPPAKAQASSAPCCMASGWPYLSLPSPSWSAAFPTPLSAHGA